MLWTLFSERIKSQIPLASSCNHLHKTKTSASTIHVHNMRLTFILTITYACRLNHFLTIEDCERPAIRKAWVFPLSNMLPTFSQIPVYSFHQNTLGSIFTWSPKSPCFPVLNEQNVLQAVGNRTMTNSIECSKLNFLYVFKVPVYLHGILKNIGSA